MRRALIVSAALALASLSLAGSAPPQQVSARVDAAIQRIDGLQPHDWQVTVGEGINTLPNTITSEGYGAPSTPESVIFSGLQSPAALHAWVLCASELHAQATILRGVADTMHTFPKDAPYNYADKNGNVTESDAHKADRIRQNAARYDRAAELAQRERVPCVMQGRPMWMANFVAIPGYDESGRELTLYVPDYEVLTPVEYFAHVGDCVQLLDMELKRIMAKPIDKMPMGRGPIDTFSERDKANAIVRLNAEMDMIRTSGVHVPCITR
jgi:hypothetical protein